MRKHCCGQSLAEYGLVTALVAVVAVPALIILGSNLRDDVQAVAQAIGDPLGTPRAAAPAPVETGPVSIASTLDPLATSEESQAALQAAGSSGQASYDPVSGQITFPLPEANGGGTATSSVDGITEVLAKKLYELGANGRDAKGNPLPAELRVRLQQLGLEALDVAGYQKNILSQLPADGTVDAADHALGIQYRSLRSDSVAVREQYDSVMQLMGEQSQYAELRGLVETYTGVIGSVTYQKFLAAHPDTADSGRFMNEMGQSLDLSGVSGYEGQRMSEQSARQMVDLSQP